PSSARRSSRTARTIGSRTPKSSSPAGRATGRAGGVLGVSLEEGGEKRYRLSNESGVSLDLAHLDFLLLGPSFLERDHKVRRELHLLELPLPVLPDVLVIVAAGHQKALAFI